MFYLKRLLPLSALWLLAALFLMLLVQRVDAVGKRPLVARCVGIFREDLPNDAVLSDVSRGGAFGDYDNDSDPDLLLFDFNATRVYRNDGGTFVDVGVADDNLPALFSADAAWGDFDGDNDLDVALIGSTNGLVENVTARIFRNDGGTFVDSGTVDDALIGVYLGSIDWGDYDNDNDSDLLITGVDATNTRITKLYVNSSGTFVDSGVADDALTGISQGAARFGDYDNDDDLDIALSGRNGFSIGAQVTEIYRNDGGTFVDVGTADDALLAVVTSSVAWADYDMDNDLDLLVSGDDKRPFGQSTGPHTDVYRNDGGVFSDIGAADAALVGIRDGEAIWGDYDNDNDPDILLAGEAFVGNGTTAQIFRNDGGTFVDSGDVDSRLQGFFRGEADWSDYDGDGDLDILLSGNQNDLGTIIPFSQLYLNDDCAPDLFIDKSVTPFGVLPGERLTYTLQFGNQGKLTATNVLLTDTLAGVLGNVTIGSSGVPVSLLGGSNLAWSIDEIAPGLSGTITIAADYLASGSLDCQLVNSATIATAGELLLDDNSSSAATQVRAEIEVGAIDPGATLMIDGAPVVAGALLPLTLGDTVVFSSTFEGKAYRDTLDLFECIEVSVRAAHFGPADSRFIDLGSDLPFSPFDIFIIHGESSDQYSIDGPTTGKVRILGLHLDMIDAELDSIGDSELANSSDSAPVVFYGTVENSGDIELDLPCGAIFNRIIAEDLLLNSGCEEDADIVMQEVILQDDLIMDDTEVSWWWLTAGGTFKVDDFDGVAINDELPEKALLDSDPMVWFKATQPQKWQLYPVSRFDGQGDNQALDVDNFELGDYNFWELQLGADFLWVNDDDGSEHAHFLGPKTTTDRIDWTYREGPLYINFFGDNSNHFVQQQRFDGDSGSAGADFWRDLLGSGYGFAIDGADNIVAPTHVLHLREGTLHTLDDDGIFSTTMQIAAGQDLIITSDTDTLTFTIEHGAAFEQGADAHWIVEDDLTYSGDVPTDESFNIEVLESGLRSRGVIDVVATNDYQGGDDSASSMYAALRPSAATGRPYERHAMSFDSDSGEWSATITLADDTEYELYVVATQNDGIYGKAESFTVGGSPMGVTLSGAATSHATAVQLLIVLLLLAALVQYAQQRSSQTG